MFVKDWSCAPSTAVSVILGAVLIGVPFAQVAPCYNIYIRSYLSQINIGFKAFLVGALQAEDVDQWEMWKCQVSEYIPHTEYISHTVISNYQFHITIL